MHVMFLKVALKHSRPAALSKSKDIKVPARCKTFKEWRYDLAWCRAFMRELSRHGYLVHPKFRAYKDYLGKFYGHPLAARVSCPWSLFVCLFNSYIDPPSRGGMQGLSTAGFHAACIRVVGIVCHLILTLGFCPSIPFGGGRGIVSRPPIVQS